MYPVSEACCCCSLNGLYAVGDPHCDARFVFIDSQSFAASAFDFFGHGESSFLPASYPILASEVSSFSDAARAITDGQPLLAQNEELSRMSLGACWHVAFIESCICAGDGGATDNSRDARVGGLSAYVHFFWAFLGFH